MVQEASSRPWDRAGGRSVHKHVSTRCQCARPRRLLQDRKCLHGTSLTSSSRGPPSVIYATPTFSPDVAACTAQPRMVQSLHPGDKNHANRAQDRQSNFPYSGLQFKGWLVSLSRISDPTQVLQLGTVCKGASSGNPWEMQTLGPHAPCWVCILLPSRSPFRMKTLFPGRYPGSPAWEGRKSKLLLQSQVPFPKSLNAQHVRGPAQGAEQPGLPWGPLELPLQLWSCP